MCLRNRKSDLRGGALYYVIFVVFVLTAVSSLFIMHRGARVRQVQQDLAYFTCMDDLNSALIVYLSDTAYNGQAKLDSIVLFNDSSRRIHVAREAYGLLDLITAQTSYHGKTMSKTVLAGKDPFRSDTVALYMPDRNQTLYASGNTIIHGNAWLPAKGMQRASIEGKPLRADSIVDGRLNKSDDSLPELALPVQEKLGAMLDLDSLCQHAIPISELYQASLDHPVTEGIKWYGSFEDYQISGFQARGGVGFCSAGTILIRSDADLHGTLVSAASIIVEDGFEGEVQLFARDSLDIGMHCRLKYPSVAVLSSDQVNNLHMSVGDSTLVEGTILVRQSQLVAKEPFLMLKEGSLVRGQVYHQGQINLLGAIHGSLYCESFYLKTDRAFYENHLLDNEIDFLKLPPHLVSIDLIHAHHDQVIDIMDQKL